jgi:soluble lytic murein transglycosylase-like protein
MAHPAALVGAPLGQVRSMARLAEPKGALRVLTPGLAHPLTVVPASYSSVADWISQAVSTLEAQGYSASQMNPADIQTIIMHESSGNPQAANYSDGNAAKGTPSQGLMQIIDPTFQSYALAGFNDVWNPVDNIIAGVRYAIARYGSVSNVPGVVSVNAGGSYMGY